MNEKFSVSVKEIDRYNSVKHKNKTLREFILYTMYGNTRIDAYTEIGVDAVDSRLQFILQKHNLNNIHVNPIPYVNR